MLDNKIVNRGRNTSIDVAKGITMLLVIWKHVCNNLPVAECFGTFNGFIGTMYMPCFFLLSGYFLKQEAFGSFVRKKIQTLLWPFIFTYLLSFVIAILVDNLMPGVMKNEVNIMNVFYSRNFTNGPIWFLSALFMAMIVVYWINRLPRESYRIVAAVVVGTLGYYWNRLFCFRLPMFFDTGLTAVLFVYAGRWIKQLTEKENKRFDYLLFGVLTFTLGFNYGMGCSMQDNSYPDNIILFVTTSTIGTLAVVLISKAIMENRILQYIGRNSLIILCFHMFVIMVAALVVKKMNLDNALALILCFVISTIVIIAIIPIVKKTLFFVFK